MLIVSIEINLSPICNVLLALLAPFAPVANREVSAMYNTFGILPVVFTLIVKPRGNTLVASMLEQGMLMVTVMARQRFPLRQRGFGL